MCKYCTFEGNGDFPQDYQNIIEVPDFQITVDQTLERDSFKVSVEAKETIALQCGVDQYNNLFAFLFDPTGESDRDRVFTGKINYCPMCGRKL